MLSGSEILEQVKNINVTFGQIAEIGGRGKRSRGGGRTSQDDTQQWKKKSIFFELPYWEHNLLLHNLDFMHIEKNVCDNVIYTLLNDAKSKDHIFARRDLQSMGCRHDHCARWLFKRLSWVQRCGQSSDKYGMLKSHDCHVLKEQFLPLAMRVGLPKVVSTILIELCSFFRKLCGKVLCVPDLDKMQHDIVLTLCHMEMLFPPSFFTVMVHLIVHLVEKAKLGGLVHYRWMYPIERYLGSLKSYVCNKARPEGSIAEGCLMQEILTFCSRYLDNIETRWNRPSRVDDEPNDVQPKTLMDELFPHVGKPIGGSSYFTLTSKEKLQAHRHVLTNCPVVDRYLQEFREVVRRQLRNRTRNPAEIDKKAELDEKIDDPSFEKDACVEVFGKEHPGRVRGMGFGITPTQFFGPTYRYGSSSSSSSTGPTSSEFEKMKLKLQASNETVAALKQEVAKVPILEAQVTYLMQHFGGQFPPTLNQGSGIGSPAEVRRSSNASHDLPSDGHGSSP